MTLPASGSISLDSVNVEVGSAVDSLDWVLTNSHTTINSNCGVKNLNSIHGFAWYQNNTAGNCNNGNCTTANCNCGTLNCNNCSLTAINCANCDTRAWLQPNCNCACTYNCTQVASMTYNCNCNCTSNCGA